MESSYRLFNCEHCHRQLKICSCCDRGNIYCPADSKEARRIRSRRSSAIYQRTESGRVNHKVRQQRYLIRRDEHKEEVRSKKMTHRGPHKAKKSLAPYTCSAPKQPAGRKEFSHERASVSLSEKFFVLDASCITGTTAVVGKDEAAALDGAKEVRCDFCGRRCGDFARLEPIRRRLAPTRKRRRARPPIHRPLRC